MPVFYFDVRGECLELARVALTAAFIPTGAVFPAYSVGDPSSEREVVRLTAVLEEESEEAAQARVGEALPGGYELERRDLTAEF
jgi:hypothetical protein